jgi:hypothetical protein
MERAKSGDAPTYAFPEYAPTPHPDGLTTQAVNPPQSAVLTFVNSEVLVAYSLNSTYYGDAAYGLAA